MGEKRKEENERGCERMGNTGVSHADNAWLGMLQYEVLVLELLPEDGFPASSISVSEISSLAHKSRNYSVEFAPSKSIPEIETVFKKVTE